MAMLGYIPWDASLVDSVRQQKALLQGHPNSSAGRQFMALAKKLKAEWEKGSRTVPLLFRPGFMRSEYNLPAEP